MRPQVLLIDANWDLATRYLFAFRERFVVSYFGRHSRYSVDRLVGADVVQPRVDNWIRSNRVKYISAAGHGLYNIFRGYRDNVIWEAGRDLSHLAGSIVHLSACETGASLGRAIVAQGAVAFWGYTEKFRFYRQPKPPADLHKDTEAEASIKMDCLIDLGILNQQDADSIYTDVVDYAMQAISGLPLNSPQRAVILHNLRHLVCPITTWGDPFASL